MLAGSGEHGPATETIGLFFPIHMNATPCAVVQFIRQSYASFAQRYVLAVVTHGGVPGRTGAHLDQVLQTQGATLQAYFQVKMVHNTPKVCVPKLLMQLDWEKNITAADVETKLNQAYALINDIAGRIERKEVNFHQCRQHAAQGISYWFMKQLWRISERRRPKNTIFYWMLLVRVAAPGLWCAPQAGSS